MLPGQGYHLPQGAVIGRDNKAMAEIFSLKLIMCQLKRKLMQCSIFVLGDS
jgi:hypothetical protein